MPVLASNFDGLIPFIVGIPLTVAALGLLSFWPAARGHWSGPVLAAPCLLIGLLLTGSILLDPDREMVLPALWIVYPAPLLVGIASVALWQKRRSQRPRE